MSRKRVGPWLKIAALAALLLMPVFATGCFGTAMAGAALADNASR